ncbi:flagellar protein FliS (plasmid) [Clostridium perfringens]
MNYQEMLRRKLEYATPQELLFILLTDTDTKFKNVINFWKNNDVQGTILAGRLIDNIIELKSTLNTNIGNESTQLALKNIDSLYEFITNEISLASVKKDYLRLEGAYEVFLEIKSIFDTDRANMRK